MDLRDCLRFFFLPHWGFSEQETATSKTLAHACARECPGGAGAATDSGHCHSCQGPALSPALLDATLHVPCPWLCQNGATGTVTDPWCKPCGCAGTPRASGAATAVPSSTTETETPLWSPLVPPRQSLGRTRRSQPLWLAMTPPCHRWVPPAEGQMCPHMHGTQHGAISDPQELPQAPPSSNQALLRASIW